MKKWLKRIAVALAALAGTTIALLVVWHVRLHDSLPTTKGTIEVAGLTGSAQIVRDKYGVPHISGDTPSEIYFALGFAHAQDRLWQMEMIRRIGQGRLSELFGSLATDADILLRTIDLYGAASRGYAALPSEIKSPLVAYSDGVNAFLEHSDGALPPEFSILRHRPEAWKPEDSAVIIKFMAVGLSSNAFREVIRTRLNTILPSDKIAELMPPQAPVIAELPKPPQEAQQAEAYLAARPLIGASNNWVVDGSRTKSGKPLLANDPHLGLSTPSVWYLAHLAFPDQDVVGGTLPGVPAVILGRNDHISWGFTNTGGDVQDIFVEKLNPENDGEYLTPDGFEAFETRTETIKVRLGSDIETEIRRSRHGPVIPTDLGFTSELAVDGHVFALAWTALSDDDETLRAGMSVMFAQSSDAFLSALRHYHAPMQSMVYADVSGDIGLIAPARVPKRKSENTARGLTPVPGWIDTYDWDGFLPFEALPQWSNPDSGQLWTANNQIVPDSYPHLISLEWDDDHRARRIETLLNQTDAHTIETFAAMQMDDISQLAVDLLPSLLETVASEKLSVLEIDAWEALSDWDHVMRVDQAEPLIFIAWMRELSRQLISDELGDQFFMAWGYNPDMVSAVLAGEAPFTDWCDDVSSEATETCTDIAKRAFKKSIARIVSDYGSRIDTWQWGHAHQAVHSHTPFGSVPVIKNFFNIEQATSGGPYTLNRGQNRLGSARPFANIHGSGYRAIYDLSDLDKSAYMISTGQSGNPLSKHYADLSVLWAEGTYIEITTDPDEIEDQAVAALTLSPRKSADGSNQ